ncbi:lytic transglycosylase domain-containing protein [Paenibacillus xerothermodurans]|uniref:Lytic transglycosylase domain-containing protein n=1 Tax=Paenibacillus xerothermodurans TaxID=1977292 RepID=A0A2W1P1P3_PAEXE|nr:lytic transglycosylase domain-containing protein [Paenibacillus xerothermodurans]PZE21038.1 lytic transglycosylase domain-containing protein [Paenibacillus xerothermodurans]
MSWGFWRKKRVFALFLLAFILFMFLSSNIVSKWLYPIQYEDEIRLNANKYNLDPFLIAAIVRVESNYQTKIESKKGAYGLMQLMPETSQWIVEIGQFSPSYNQKLHDPMVSIQLGSWYLKWLHKELDGNTVAVIASYNAGQGKVRQWLNNGRWDGTREHVDDIPYGETRHYIQRVLYYYNKYHKLYADDWRAR